MNILKKFKKYSFLAAIVAVFTFASSGAFAGLGNDGIGCKKKNQMIGATWDGYTFFGRQFSRMKYYVRAKSTIKARSAITTKLLNSNGSENGGVYTTSATENRSDSKCTGGCGPSCGSGIPGIRQIGTADCADHDMCGNVSYNSNPNKDSDRSCGDERKDATNDYVNYAVFSIPLAIRYGNCRRKWR